METDRIIAMQPENHISSQLVSLVSLFDNSDGMRFEVSKPDFAVSSMYNSFSAAKNYVVSCGRWYSNTPDDANQYGFDALSANFDHFIEYCEYSHIPMVIVHGQDLSGINSFGQRMYFIADEQFYPQLVADGSDPLKSFKAFMRSSYGSGFAYFIETGDQQTQAHRYVKDKCKNATGSGIYKSKCAFGLIHFPAQAVQLDRLNDIAPFYYDCCGVYQYYHNYVKSLCADYSYHLTSNKYNVNYPTPVNIKLIIQTIRWAFSNYKAPSADTYYTVKFLDHDETVLKTESVLSGGQATPPDDPIREGYDFTGWKPAYTNIVQDITCYAQYEQQQPCAGNNISSQLVTINFSEKMLSVGDYSFSGCGLLSAVTGGRYLKFIGTDAFRNCTSLVKFSRFNDTDSSHTFDIVGNNAFDNTRLQQLYLSLRSSSIYTFWGDYCFANNPSLTSVHFLSSSYMSNNMFCGCGNLKHVTYDNNYTSYVYPYVFRGCSSLTSITLPSKLWMISEHMFDGCASMLSVGFSDYSGSPKLACVDRSAFFGCSSLTSIEFPASISSLEQLRDGCLTNAPVLRRIKFHGIDYDQLAAAETMVVETEYKLGEMYENPDSPGKIIKEATDNNIPVIYFKSSTSNRTGNGCEYCITFNNNIDTDEIKEKIRSIKAVFIYDTVGDNDVKQLIESCRAASKSCASAYVLWGIEWMSRDGTVRRYAKSDDDGDNEEFTESFPEDRIKEILTEWGYDYEQEYTESVTTTTVVEPISKTGCFRLNHDVTLVSKDDKQINYVYDSNNTEQYEDPVTYDSDKNTVKGFQTGRWYYNSKQIKQYADETGLPLLCIYSLLGCTPCTIYENNIWDNALFQQWCQKQKFLLCGMNVQQQPYYDAALKYCQNEWSRDADNYVKAGETSEISNLFGEQFRDITDSTGRVINSTLMTPVIIFYHKPLGYSEPAVHMVYTYHDISKYLEINGVEGTTNILKRLCLYHFDDNDITDPTYCVDVDKPFSFDDLGDYEDYERFDRYYDSATGIVNLTTYGTLENLKEKFLDAFDYKDYVGGCGLADFTFFGELGITDENPEEWNSRLNDVVWKFDTSYYSLAADTSDTKNVKSTCSIGQIATGYRLLWTEVTTKPAYNMSDDGFATLDAFKDALYKACPGSDREYLGGCVVDEFQVFRTLGVTGTSLTERPQYFNDILATRQYVFSDSEKYLMQLDLDDSRAIESPCDIGTVTAYRMTWTPSN